jgi:hypothetical protein
VIQLFARGAGIAVGGLVRDVTLAWSGQFNVAYASVFVLEAVGLYVTIGLLYWVNVPTFARQPGKTADVLATLAD